MDWTDLAQLFFRWAHLSASVAWVGGSIFYLVVLNPAFKPLNTMPEILALRQRIGSLFRELTNTALVVLLITGALLTFQRLTFPGIPPVYMAVLGVKVALVAWMYFIVRKVRRRSPEPSPATAEGQPAPRFFHHIRAHLASAPMMVWLGLAVLFLALVLRLIYETLLKG